MKSIQKNKNRMKITLHTGKRCLAYRLIVIVCSGADCNSCLRLLQVLVPYESIFDYEIMCVG